MEIVVNEWLLDYMCPDAEPSARALAFRFVNAWVARCDIAVIKIPSPFVSKFYKYMGAFGWDSGFKGRFKKLNLLLFRNSEKTRIVYGHDIGPSARDLGRKAPKEGDAYLLELAGSSPGAVIVTTDRKLKEALKTEENVSVYLVEEYLSHTASRDSVG